MVASLDQYRSHPDKKLAVHIQGVLDKVRLRTSLKIAELAAIFHDLGKMNPNFQKKLDGDKNHGYSHHAYLSAYAFLCYSVKNRAIIETFANQKEWLASILALVACHHGDLPDFPHVLKEEECDALLAFLQTTTDLPISEFLQQLLPHTPFSVIQQLRREKLCKELPLQLALQITNPVRYFMETQFAFACLIAADKIDASGYQENQQAMANFCGQYHHHLTTHLATFTSDSDLNRLRTQMRQDAQQNIQKELAHGKRLFSLTAPTGSGKTMMLLALAGEILQAKGNFRMIYALPFLSIIEQVESVCHKAFGDLTEYIGRIDSKSENPRFADLQKQLDSDPRAVKKIVAEQFAENTFDYPFIITTFVRVFETLLSNHNATLLKLPNFAKTIFLLDEIQSLPPRLYGFFVAMLDSFCRKFDSYAIISTATMPNFELPDNNKHKLPTVFSDYVKPPELLSLTYFAEPVFYRYEVEKWSTPVEMAGLAEKISQEEQSLLVVLNTIQDTKDLFELLSERDLQAEIILLNTHFTPNDRKNKIARCKELLKAKQKVILVSTQLIEAGVDIDFPVVYRDLCPVSSLVQSAGRCNRNGERDLKGKVRFFELQKDGRCRAKLIYQKQDARFLFFAKEHIPDNPTPEPELLSVQKAFFSDIQINTVWGLHQGKQFANGEIDFVQALKEAKFQEIGKFQLIANEEFGEEFRFYIAAGPQDRNFEELECLWSELLDIPFKDYDRRKVHRLRLENQFKKMAGQIVQVRFFPKDRPPMMYPNCCDIWKLEGEDTYDSIRGVHLPTTAIL